MMFARIKEKYWGHMLFDVGLALSSPSRVYLWEKQGKRSLHIQSQNFTVVATAQATLCFEASEAQKLVNAIQATIDFDKKSQTTGSAQ